MNLPTLLLGAFALGILAASGGGKSSAQCVRDAAKALAEVAANRTVPQQLEFADRLDDLGYPAAAACLRAQGEQDCRPLMRIALEKELPRSPPEVLMGFAGILEAVGDAKGAKCMRDLAKRAPKQ